MNYRGITAAMVTNAWLPRKPTLKEWSTDSLLMVRKKERLCKGVCSIVRCRSQPKNGGYQMIQLNVLKGRNTEAFRKLRA